MANFGHDMCRSKIWHMATLTRSNMSFFLKRRAQVCKDWVGAEWEETQKGMTFGGKIYVVNLKAWSDGAVMKATDRNKRG